MDTNPTRILLIEDNPGDALLLQEALREKEDFLYTLEKEVRLGDGLKRIGQGNLDLILLDLFLPDSSGLATLQMLLDTAPHAPVVVLTGIADKGTAVKALQAGAQDYLVKDSLNGEVLKRSIRYAIERYGLLKKAQESEERYILAAMGSNDGLWDWNLRTGEIYFSPRWKKMLGYPEDEIGSAPSEWLDRIHPGDLARVRKELDAHLHGGTPQFASEHRLRHQDGRYRWVLIRGLAITDKSGQASRMAGSLTDITRHKNMEQLLALRAFYDPLTGLPNRAFFMNCLTRAFSRQERRPSSLLALLYLDLDRFKSVNDSLGHQAGDGLLIAFAQKLRAVVRPHDVVARMGGDEFTVLLEDLPNQGEAVEVANRLQASLKIPFALKEGKAQTSASIGIAFTGDGDLGPEDILKEADKAMYQAKSEGGARCVIHGKTAGSHPLANP